MKDFFVVIYDPDRKAASHVISRAWIMQKNENYKFGSRCYLFNHDDTNVEPPNSNIAVSLIKEADKFRESGYFYPGIVLAGFGECLINLIIYFDANFLFYFLETSESAKDYARKTGKMTLNLKVLREKHNDCQN